MLLRHKLYQFILIIMTRMFMSLIQFIRKNWSKIKKILLYLLVFFLFVAAFIGVKKFLKKSFILAEPSEIVVIRPSESQEVIIIGDPDKVTVNNKRNNRSK